MYLDKKYLVAIESGNVEYFYKSWTWQKKRQEILTRDNYECQQCKREGYVTSSRVGMHVHHKKHLRDRPDLALDNNNLETLCPYCHDREHPEKIEAMVNKNKKDKFYVDERW